MFRSTRLFAALGLALATFGAMDLPASAQGTVREHRGGDTPPAPKPGERDHRRGVRENDPAQWEVRGGAPKHCLVLMISNVLRESRDAPGMLSPAGASTGWSKDGGNWMVKEERWPITAPCQMHTLQPNEPVALYSAKMQRYLNARLEWSKTPEHVWNIKKTKHVEHDGMSFTRFAIYSTVARRYLMLCHDEADRKQNNQKLCFYNTDQER